MAKWGMVFATKKEAGNYVKGLISSAAIDDPFSPADLDFIKCLVDRHPHADEKRGGGIVGATVRLIPPYNTRCLWLIRSDGTKIDMSWRECLHAATDRAMFSQACRTVIREAVYQFACDFWDGVDNAICPVTGGTMTSRTSDVHHKPPWEFAAIVDSYAEARRIDRNDPSLTVGVDGQVRREFTDERMGRDFLEFHNALADLQVISTYANQILLTKEATNGEVG